MPVVASDRVLLCLDDVGARVVAATDDLSLTLKVPDEDRVSRIQRWLLLDCMANVVVFSLLLLVVLLLLLQDGEVG